MKYMGSKARFANELLAIMLDKCNTDIYCEPFAGGMNIICKAPREMRRYANDSNKYLIAMWLAINQGWKPPEEVSRELYNECKSLINHPDYLIGYVGFNCSYSGKWFSGYAGLTKTAIGTERNYIKEAYKHIMRQKEEMIGVYFCNASYDKVLIPNDAIIYCDPPYANTTGYADKFDSNKFWEWVRIKSKTNKVYVSEYKAPDDFKVIWEKEAKSSLSANGKVGANKLSVERLFTLK